MTYDFDEDNSWMDALVTKVPVKAVKARAKTGKKYQMSPEFCERLRQVNLGKTHTAEARAKIGAASRGRVMPASHGAKVSANRMGHAVSAETRAKLRQANLGKTVSAQTRAKISATTKGRKVSAEFCAKISAGKTRAMMTPVGMFPSRYLFQAWLEAQGVRDVYCKIGKWLKTHPTEVYYIAKVTK
jgi:hypothetical protein